MQSSPPWQRDIKTCLTTLWLFKALATPLGVAVFFYGYFWVMRHPVGPVTVMPLTWLDQQIPFMPETFAAYVSLWVYVALAPGLARDRRELGAYGLVALAMSLVAFACYIVFPTEVPVPDVNWARHPALQFLKSADVSGNACPSLHVAFAVFSAWVIAGQLSVTRSPAMLQWINGLWCLAIIHSTLATRQHVVWDVIAGVLLGLLATVLHRQAAGRSRPRRQPSLA
ncbi:phosphatase PAP2 family protein [Xylophilus sp. GW821-FHT01B05]